MSEKKLNQLTLAELVAYSQNQRAKNTLLPKELQSILKTHPPVHKKTIKHSHIIDEQWMRLLNQKNYSPVMSIMRQNMKLPGKEKETIGKPKEQGEFKERLVDFLMDQQRSHPDTEHDIPSLILENIPTTFFPDQRTHRILTRVIDDQPVKEGEEAILEVKVANLGFLLLL